ncbi:MAG: arginine--tRNA ligase [Candidatus Levybacteria bacterium RIFCSPHIGHO2_02_FULL_37_13]|nr:MAG: arginine--tRNA ligase [Candidatus Levybacteria bacterium RIFCSPHIGHO2_02_FULL_37_13]OGH29738.1 MAG: arginine--tRNA ligase [Candidatus Levybacteria bacterium RIFCSPHIGHO2_12_FULL_37_9]OGH39407.1 MAG: arginine--tRNA ligase [Candidatus Levybacteria bacterium RIFCSPLOWO2_01_FULL_37_26]
MIPIKDLIVKDIQRIVKELTGQSIIPILEHPKDERHGDYSSNIALAIFSSSKFRPKADQSLADKVQSSKFRTPMELAEEIATKFKIQNSKFKILEKVEAVKPGFVNFYLSEKYLLENIKTVLEEKEKFGSKRQDPNKKVVIEYSSPNIAKPFTVGHLRSTIIGDAIANLLEANGWKVYRDNHLGDWGTQFGKQIYAIKTWGNEDEITKSENPVKMLMDLYVRFHQEAEKDPALEEEGRRWFKKLEDGDKETRRLWNKCIEWSLKEFRKIYDRLGISFTENNGAGYGESFFEDKMGGIINELEKKGLLKESEGAKLVFYPKNKYPPLMIIKKDGATLYATRDLATDKFRLNKYGKDVVIINEVGIEQSLYFKQIFEIEKMLGWVKDGQRIHKRHGHYRFKDEKMSTRKGNVIWLEEVLEEAIGRANKLSSGKAENTAKDVAIGAIKWNDLKRTSEQDIVFDWDEILNMEGNAGPYLQYTFARTQSVIHKASINVMPNSFQHLERTGILKPASPRGEQVQDDKMMEPEEVSLLRALQRFPEIVWEAGENFSPNLLCNYLFDLAQKFNLFYQKHKILESENRDFRLALTQAVGQVIKNGLYLLGIKAPERM